MTVSEFAASLAQGGFVFFVGDEQLKRCSLLTAMSRPRLLSPRVKREKTNLPPPPPPPPKRSRPSSELEFPWSCRMQDTREKRSALQQSQGGGVFGPRRFESGVRYSRDWAGPSSFRSVPPLLRKPQVPPPMHILRASVPLIDEMDVEDMINPVFTWMDKLHTNTLDFAVLLKFFFLVGWEPLDRRQMYIEWQEDWSSLLTFLDIKDHEWAGVGLGSFTILLEHPSRPPLLADYSLRELYQLFVSSIASKPMTMMGSGVTVPQRAGEEAFKKVQSGIGMHINEVLYFHDLARETVADFVNPDGQYNTYWEYCVFGPALKSWHYRMGHVFGNVQNTQSSLGEALLPEDKHADPPERIWQGHPISWVLFQDVKYLHINGYDIEEGILSGAVYGAQKYLPGATRQTVKLTHGQDLEEVPDDVSFGTYRGMHVMVSLNTKHKRTQCIWLALAVVHSVQGGRTPPGVVTEPAFHNEVQRFVAQMAATPLFFCFTTNVELCD